MARFHLGLLGGQGDLVSGLGLRVNRGDNWGCHMAHRRIGGMRCYEYTYKVPRTLRVGFEGLGLRAFQSIKAHPLVLGFRVWGINGKRT